MRHLPSLSFVLLTLFCSYEFNNAQRLSVPISFGVNTNGNSPIGTGFEVEIDLSWQYTKYTGCVIPSSTTYGQAELFGCNINDSSITTSTLTTETYSMRFRTGGDIKITTIQVIAEEGTYKPNTWCFPYSFPSGQTFGSGSDCSIDYGNKEGANTWQLNTALITELNLDFPSTVPFGAYNSMIGNVRPAEVVRFGFRTGDTTTEEINMVLYWDQRRYTCTLNSAPVIDDFEYCYVSNSNTSSCFDGSDTTSQFALEIEVPTSTDEATALELKSFRVYDNTGTYYQVGVFCPEFEYRDGVNGFSQPVVDGNAGANCTLFQGQVPTFSSYPRIWISNVATWDSSPSRLLFADDFWGTINTGQETAFGSITSMATDSCAPTAAPTGSPSQPPTGSPSQPPTGSPSQPPTTAPSASPVQPPTGSPSQPPTGSPSQPPTGSPSQPPTGSPSQPPTGSPSQPPTGSPSQPPTDAPTGSPSQPPTGSPSQPPSNAPTDAPLVPPTKAPTGSPSQPPTGSPSQPPTNDPSGTPSQPPTNDPTGSPSQPPTGSPSQPPTGSPSQPPTGSPSQPPTGSPSQPPTGSPSQPPTNAPTGSPSQPPTGSPSQPPTRVPSGSPSQPPTNAPSGSPSQPPTLAPSGSPTQPPTDTPSQPPTGSPSQPPTGSPSQPPTNAPSGSPTQPPTGSPTQPPTAAPSGSPSQPPTRSPSASPTLAPSGSPTQPPTNAPSGSPSQPPTSTPSQPPTNAPSGSPSQPPTSSPSQPPTDAPSLAPTDSPTWAPTFECVTMIVAIQDIYYNGTAYNSQQIDFDNVSIPLNVTHEHWNGHYTESNDTIYDRPMWVKDDDDSDGYIRWLPNSWILVSGVTGHTWIYVNDSALQPLSSQLSYWYFYLDHDLTADIELECSESLAPVAAPTLAPSSSPVLSPTSSPTDAPSDAPTDDPSIAPTLTPIDAPTNAPSDAPSETPTLTPIDAPTGIPSNTPSQPPTAAPSQPTSDPTSMPTVDCELLHIDVLNVSDSMYLSFYSIRFNGSFVSQNSKINDRQWWVRPRDSSVIQWSGGEWTIQHFDDILQLDSSDYEPPMDSRSKWEAVSDGSIVTLYLECRTSTYDPTSDPTLEPTWDPTLEPTEPTFNPTTEPTMTAMPTYEMDFNFTGYSSTMESSEMMSPGTTSMSTSSPKKNKGGKDGGFIEDEQAFGLNGWQMLLILFVILLVVVLAAIIFCYKVKKDIADKKQAKKDMAAEMAAGSDGIEMLAPSTQPDSDGGKTGNIDI